MVDRLATLCVLEILKLVHFFKLFPAPSPPSKETKVICTLIISLKSEFYLSEGNRFHEKNMNAWVFQF